MLRAPLEKADKCKTRWAMEAEVEIVRIEGNGRNHEHCHGKRRTSSTAHQHAAHAGGRTGKLEETSMGTSEAGMRREVRIKTEHPKAARQVQKV